MKRILFAIIAIATSTNLVVTLFPLYQAKFHVNNFILTSLFVTYIVFLLPSLLIAGPLGDRKGHRYIAISGIFIGILAAGLFSVATSLWILFLARSLTGISVGLFLGTGNALLLRHSPKEKIPLALKVSAIGTLAGFGLGPAISGIVFQYSSWKPDRLAFLILLGILIIAVAFLFTVGKTLESNNSQSKFRIRLGIPTSHRHLFWFFVGPLTFAGFALNGTIIAMMPIFVRSVMHSTDHASVGLLLLLLFGGAAIAQLIPIPKDFLNRARIGFILLLIGTWVMIIAGTLESMVLLWIGLAIQALGTGWVFQSSLRLTGTMGPPSERARVISTFYVVAYLGFSIPTLGVGFLTVIWGLIPALVTIGALTTVFGLVIISFSFRKGSFNISSPINK